MDKVQQGAASAAEEITLIHSDTKEELASVPLSTLLQLSARASALNKRDNRPSKKHLFMYVCHTAIPVIRNIAEWPNGKITIPHIALTSSPSEVIDACVNLRIPLEMVNIHAAVREWVRSQNADNIYELWYGALRNGYRDILEACAWHTAVAKLLRLYQRAQQVNNSIMVTEIGQPASNLLAMELA